MHCLHFMEKKNPKKLFCFFLKILFFFKPQKTLFIEWLFHIIWLWKTTPTPSVLKNYFIVMLL